MGTGPAGLAHRVLGHGPAVPGRRLRHPRRRPRPHLPAPRERDRPERGGRAALRARLDAQRHDPRRRARRWPSRSATSSCCARSSTATGPPSCSPTSSPRTTAAHWSSRTDKLDEARAAYGAWPTPAHDLDFRSKPPERRGGARPAILAQLRGATARARRLRRAHGRRSEHRGGARRAVRASSATCYRYLAAVDRGARAARRRPRRRRGLLVESFDDSARCRGGPGSTPPTPLGAALVRRGTPARSAPRVRSRCCRSPPGRRGPLGRRRRDRRRPALLRRR